MFFYPFGGASEGEFKLLSFIWIFKVIIERPEELICRVPKLMLMYGGGHMLLKDTAFELRKGKRYGVVGRNGCGKTTLMNLLAKGHKGRIKVEIIIAEEPLLS
jgi:ABC-type polysaccharide/polyol phosphate transport system ATPase subunit